MTTLEAIVLGIIEGLTEFLPVSSTGHMMIGSAVMGIAPTDFVKLFTVAIQLGCILSVVVLYFKRFFQNFTFYLKLFVAFLPAVFFGILCSDIIDKLLENVLAVGITLFVGGIIFLFIDGYFIKNEQLQQEDKPTYLEALKIGMFQVIAMIPGVSRSAATIIGGQFQGLNRKTAAEFSFFLAVPTMFAATAKSLYSYRDAITAEHLPILALGNFVAFVVGILAIKTFIGLLTRYGFKPWGYYRILLGGTIIILHLLHVKMAIL